MNISERVLKAVQNSYTGVASLEILDSLKICSRSTLKITLSRLGKSRKILALKRGFYSVNPVQDIYYCAQVIFNGYLGFSTALYLQGLITENPFIIMVVTTDKSARKKIGEYEIRAIALKEKAVGFQRKNNYIISTPAKTLFDCLYLPRYSIEREKLIDSFRKLTKKDFNEFDSYVNRFAGRKKVYMKQTKKIILK